MPLQPRRTWSAEDERRRRLEEDPDAYDVGPHSVTCAGCHRPIRLNATGRYYAANWNKHKMGCKNTNAVNGAGAMSVESKFTGRVAAFRVAKPAEISEPLNVSSISTSSTTLGVYRGLTQDSGQLPHRPFAGEQWRSRTGEQAFPATSHYSRRPPSQPYRHASHDSEESRDRPPSTHLYGKSYMHAEPPASGVIGNDERQAPLRLKLRSHSSSPKGPPPRLAERGAYGPTGTPYRAERYWKEQRSHGMSIPSMRHPREGSTPRHQSEDTPHRAAYLHPPETQRLLDKGKERYIDYNRSDSYQHAPSRTSALSNPGYHENVRNRGTQMQDGGNSLDLTFGRPVVSEAGSPSSTGWSRTEGLDLSDLDSSSTASPPIFSRTHPRGLHYNIRSLPSDVSHQSKNRFDDRVLPPLSSLSLVQKGFSSGASASLDYSRDRRSKEHHDDWGTMVSSEERPMWRQRTRAWVQSAVGRPAVDRESPESVVLPPIRSPSVASLEGHRATKRRQREGSKSGDNYMDDDRPSAPKAFALPADSSPSSSTLRADDLSFKYKHKNVSLEADRNVGGDSIFVGNHSDPSKDVAAASSGDAGRLHPVWKWEHKEDPAPEPGGPERGSDNAMKTGDIS